MTQNQTNTRSLKAWGREARNRAVERAGHGRPDAFDWIIEIDEGQAKGYTIAQLSYALNLTESRIHQIKREAYKQGRELAEDYWAVKPYDALDTDLQDCLEVSADGFARFYERFAPWSALPEHCHQWVSNFIEYPNSMVNIPPGHIKSSIMAVWLPIWILTVDRNSQVILLSKTKSLAVRNSREVEAHLRLNSDLISAFGRYAPSEQKGETWRPGQGELIVVGRTKVLVSGDFSLQCKGMEQQILGSRATQVIGDDITDSKAARSEIAATEERRKLHEEALNRLEPYEEDGLVGRAIMVGQRVDVEDIYGHLEAEVHRRGPRKGEKLWHVTKQPAIMRWADEDPENPEPIVLWPEKWTFDALMDAYERVGGHDVFETMYQQRPVATGGGLIDLEWIEACYDRGRPGYEGVRTDNPTQPSVRVASVDPSPTKDNGLIVADVLSVGSQYSCSIIEAKRWQGGFNDLKREIYRCIRQYQIDYFIFEESTFLHWFKEDPFFEEVQRRCRFIPHNTNRNKGDPELGFHSIAGDFEFGRIRLPGGDEAGRRMAEMIVAELLAYPRGTYDLSMALWFIKWNRRRLRPLAGQPDHFDGAKPGERTWRRFRKTAKETEGQRIKQWRERNRGDEEQG